MNNLYEALEICLKEMEHGVDVDTVLSRYPELAGELRPMLEASVEAKAMAVPAPSQEVLRRNRAKLLQHAAELRERKVAPVSRRVWSVPLRRALVSFMVVVMLFVSSTGLVRASSNTLPGDNLYPVKRVWENVSLFFTFDANLREALELEHEHERLEELQELFIEGRSVDVMFAGYVTRQGTTEWRVAGITILITPETRLPAQPVEIGAAVRILGKAQDGVVTAERIELLAPGSIVPDVEDDESEIEEETPEELDDEHEDDSGSGSKPEATAVPIIKTPTKFKPENVSLEGVITSVKNNLIVINGIAMDISLAEIKGDLNVGSVAKVEGYYDANGIFIVTKIEFESGEPNSGSGSDDDDSSNDNSDDNNENDNEDNANDDDNGDDNSNDDDDDNSGSGGGGDDDDD